MIRFTTREYTVQEMILAKLIESTGDPQPTAILISLRTNLSLEVVMKLPVSQFVEVVRELGEDMERASTLTKLALSLGGTPIEETNFASPRSTGFGEHL